MGILYKIILQSLLYSFHKQSIFDFLLFFRPQRFQRYDPSFFSNFHQMLKRTTQRAKHKKLLSLGELLSSSNKNVPANNTISYDCFNYADKMMDKKITIGAAKNVFSTQMKKKHVVLNTSSQRQSNNQNKQSFDSELFGGNECELLMKSTKYFQTKNRSRRLFFKKQRIEQKKQQFQVRGLQKRKNRQQIKSFINGLSRKEFRKYLNSQQKNKMNIPNLLHIQNNIQKVQKASKQTIYDLLYQQKQLKKSSFNNVPDISLPGEENLDNFFVSSIRIKQKQFEYLIHSNHLTHIYNHIMANSRNPMFGDLTFNYNISNLAFSQIQSTLPTKKFSFLPNTAKEDQKVDWKHRQLVLNIEKGSVYDFLFLTIKWPDLLNYRDQMNNNLLHVAAKADRSQIYVHITQKVGWSMAQENNKNGKTPIDLAILFGSQKVQKLNLEHQKQTKKN